MLHCPCELLHEYCAQWNAKSVYTNWLPSIFTHVQLVYCIKIHSSSHLYKHCACVCVCVYACSGTRIQHITICTKDGTISLIYLWPVLQVNVMYYYYY